MRIRLTSALLRPWDDGDVDALVRHANDEAVAQYLALLPHPYGRVHAEEFLQRRRTAASDDVVLAIEVAGEAAGAVGIEGGKGIHAHVARLGYWLGRCHWGKGIMSEAVRAAVTLAFEGLGYERLESTVYAENRASVRVLQKNGFRHEGTCRQRIRKGGHTYDELLFARLLSDG